MPTATFLNLPKEKQTKILNAAKHEFGKNSVEEASVKNIVTEAEIPRGSFYAYFHDKEDLYHYILEEYRTVSNKSTSKPKSAKATVSQPKVLLVICASDRKSTRLNSSHRT